MPSQTDRSADVVVVGAGLSGLAAAREVRRAGRSVSVFEARDDRVGGRVETHRTGGAALDLGGAWIGAAHGRVARLAAELGLATYRSHSNGTAVALRRGKREMAHGPAAVAALVDHRRATRRLERLSRGVAPAAPWATRDAQRLDDETLESWLVRTARLARTRRNLRSALTNLIGVEPAQVSLLHALFYIRSSGGFDPLFSYEGGAQQDLLAAGAQALAIGLADELGDAVVLDAPVVAIEQEASAVRVHAASVVTRAAVAVIAMAPHLAGRMTFSPPLPAARDQLMQRMPHGDVTKVVVSYEHAFWRAQGLNGEAWGDTLPFSFTHDVGGPDSAPGALAIFFAGARARALREQEDASRRRIVLDALAACFGDAARHPGAYLERDWSADPWSRGAYAGFMPPGVWSRYGRALRAPIGQIVWAGTETAIGHNGYMEGALEAGERAADEALARL